MSMRHDTILRWIDAQRDRMLDRVIAWAKINSGSYNLAGLARMSDALNSELGTLGAEVSEIELPPQELIDARGEVQRVPLGKALAATKRPDARVLVFLCIHSDTVYAADHAFQTVQRVDDTTLRGPGVADAKGGLVVMLAALAAVERSEFASEVGWEVLISPDEELGSPGSSALLTAAAKRNHLGLVFEPSLPDGTLVGARGGSGNFTIVVRGRSAHAGRDLAAGRNAIHAVAEFVVALQSLQSSGIGVNVGKIEGGGPVNVVPDLAIARFNLRVASVDDQKRAEDRVRELVEQLNRKDGIRATLHGRFQSPPKPMDARTEHLSRLIADCGKDLGLNLAYRPTAGVCDGNRLAAAGLPVIDSLGVRGGNLHSPEEYMLIDSLTERAKLTALLLLKLAASEMVFT